MIARSLALWTTLSTTCVSIVDNMAARTDQRKEFTVVLPSPTG